MPRTTKNDGDSVRPVDAVISRQSAPRDGIIEYGILALAAFSPLPAASVPEWAMLVIELGAIALAAVYTAGRPKAGTLPDNGMKWPRRLWAAFALFLIIQVIPLPGALVGLLSPMTYARKIPYAGGSPAWMSLSVVPDRTLREGLFLAACLLLGVLIVATMRNRSRIIRMIWVLVGLGVFESLYGLLQVYSGNPRILFYPKTYNLDSVTGTFVNRNHLSGYLEMIIPLAIGLAVSRLSILGSSRRRLRDTALQMSEKRFLVNTALFLSLLVMGLGVLFSKSRSGVFVFAIIFLLFFGGILMIKEKLGERKGPIVLSLQVLFAVILGVSLYAGISSTMSRFGMDKFLREQRPQFWAGTLRQFAEFPVFGTGLGTFSSVYPGSEEFNIRYHIYHAHNDFLEYLSELGLVGSVLLFGAVLATLMRAYAGWKARRSREIRSLALGGFISIFAILLHSITDFNMHIPANLVLFTIVTALTVAIVRCPAVRRGADPAGPGEDLRP